MSLSTLDIPTLELLVSYLKMRDVARLVASGDAVLCSKLHRTVHDFAFKLRGCWPRDSLFTFVRRFEARARSFRLQIDGSQAKSTQVDWSLLPPELASFTLYCSICPPFPNLISAHFPFLQEFVVDGVFKDTLTVAPGWLPSSLTVLSINLSRLGSQPSKTHIKNLLDYLPPNLVELKVGGRLTLDEHQENKLDLRHLPLDIVKLEILNCSPHSLDWTFLPPTIRSLDILTEVPISGGLGPRPGQSSRNEPIPAPPLPITLKSLFPRLETLCSHVESLIPVGSPDDYAKLEFPETLTSYSRYVPQGSITNPAFNHQFAIKTGHNMRHLDFPMPIAMRLEHFPMLPIWNFGSAPWYPEDLLPEDDDFTFMERQQVVADLSRKHGNTLFAKIALLKNAKAVQLPFLPLPAQLRCLAPSVETMKVDLHLARKGKPEDGEGETIADIRSEDWPSSLETLDLMIYYTDQLEPLDLPTFDFSCLPSSLTKLSLNIVNARVDDRFGKASSLSLKCPFFKGSLAHLTRLQALSANPCDSDCRSYFDSSEMLPPSLTKLFRINEGLIPVETLLSPENATLGQKHYFDRLKQMRFHSRSPSHPRGDVGDDGYLEAMEAYTMRLERAGMNTKDFKRLPPNLEDLLVTPRPSSPKWSDLILESLPRNLTYIWMPFAQRIDFEEETAVALHSLPPRLGVLVWGVVGEDDEDTSLLPPDFKEHLPPGVQVSFNSS